MWSVVLRLIYYLVQDKQENASVIKAHTRMHVNIHIIRIYYLYKGRLLKLRATRFVDINIVGIEIKTKISHLQRSPDNVLLIIIQDPYIGLWEAESSFFYTFFGSNFWY